MLNPDLEIRGGARSSRPFDKGWGGGRSLKNFLGPFEPQFSLKLRGAGPPGPLRPGLLDIWQNKICPPLFTGS